MHVFLICEALLLYALALFAHSSIALSNFVSSVLFLHVRVMLSKTFICLLELRCHMLAENCMYDVASLYMRSNMFVYFS